MRLSLFFACWILPAFASAQASSAVAKDTLPAASVLERVIVSGSKKQITFKDGHIIVNVENSPLSAVADPFDLLSKIPTVIASSDGSSLSIAGKGQPIIYIDNQRMSLEDLRSFPVASIKSIEIINNPSVKYESDGRAVIKITRKINNKEGWKSAIAQTAAYRKYYINRSQADITIRKKKFELKGNLQYNHLKTWEGNAFDFQLANNNIFSRYSVTAVTTRAQIIAGGGFFYQINEQDDVSANISTRKSSESFPIYTDSYLSTPSQQQSVTTGNYSRQPVKYTTSNINYNHKVKKGTLFAGAQYTQLMKDLQSDIYNSFDNGPENITQNRRQQSLIHAFAVRTDVERQFDHDIKWEIGSGYTYAFANGRTQINSYQPVDDLRSAFNYTENNYAVYSQLSGKLNKISWSGGARMESINIKSNYNDSINTTTRSTKNIKLFPKGNIRIPIDSSSSVLINFAKTISRPDYTNANQVSVYINPYFEWANNINLGPAINSELTTTLQHNNASIAFSLYQTKGVVYDDFVYNEQAMLLKRMQTNYKKESGVSVMLTAPFTYKSWSSTNIISMIFNTVKDDATGPGKSRPFLYTNTNNQFKLPNGFTFTITGWAVSKSYQGAFERNALFSVDTSLTKLFGKHLTCSVRFDDMFASISSKEKFAIHDVAANGVYYDRSREVSIGLKYAFGQLKETKYRNRDVDDSINRIK